MGLRCKKEPGVGRQVGLAECWGFLVVLLLWAPLMSGAGLVPGSHAKDHVLQG